MLKEIPVSDVDFGELDKNVNRNFAIPLQFTFVEDNREEQPFLVMFNDENGYEDIAFVMMRGEKAIQETFIPLNRVSITAKENISLTMSSSVMNGTRFMPAEPSELDEET